MKTLQARRPACLDNTARPMPQPSAGIGMALRKTGSELAPCPAAGGLPTGDREVLDGNPHNR
ncbi:hypothetical protein XYCOK13_15990 [Xylanibacillus composti]|uniref:Uncharacterized protein n=1 Tax=Xylanibacillus composti TaxID=1572762 RepID=A0A8J4M1E2_9BACL|nr:hypothetical protein XYCOK13_15990 [Xylanibacillus composti]